MQRHRYARGLNRRQPMRLSISSTNVQEWSGDVLVVGLPKGDPSTTAVNLESRFPGVSSALNQQAFEG